QREGTECIPNNLMMALHLAHRTKNIKLGCGFNITPMWHPLRLAEDYATADILTGGRVIFGVGRGYHTREVETFGAPLLDQPANRELFEEQVDIIFKAFNSESFSHKGKHYTLPPEVPYRGYTLKELTLVPRPFKLPVECWQPIQSGSPRALEFMAKHGIQGMVGGGSAEGGAMHKVVVDWQAAHARLGKEIELGERLCFGFHFYMANSREQGMKEAAKYYEENMKMFGELRLVRAITEEQIEIMRDPKRAPTAKLPRIEDAVKAGGFLCGNAGDLIEHIKALEKKYPALDRVSVSLSVGAQARARAAAWRPTDGWPTCRQPSPSSACSRRSIRIAWGSTARAMAAPLSFGSAQSIPGSSASSASSGWDTVAGGCAACAGRTNGTTCWPAP